MVKGKGRNTIAHMLCNGAGWQQNDSPRSRQLHAHRRALLYPMTANPPSSIRVSRIRLDAPYFFRTESVYCNHRAF